MNFSLYSFTMAVAWSSIFMLLLYLFRRKPDFVMAFGVWPLLAIAVFSIIRCFFPLEVLSFTRVISSEGLTQFNTFLYEPLEDTGLSLLAVLGLIWLTGSIALFVFFLAKSISYRLRLRAYEPADEDAPIFQSAQESAREAGIKKFRIYVDPKTETPALVGIFFPIVEVPSYPYTETDYVNIFRHEFTHWNNHDVWIKVLVELLHCIFWWNPLTYMLKLGVDDALEIKCDIVANDGRPDPERISYAETLQKTMRFARERRDSNGPGGKNGGGKRRSPIAIVEFANTARGTKRAKKFFLERTNVILNYHRPKHMRAIMAVTLVVMTCLMVFSYSFVIQPRYAEIPEEDIEIETHFEMTPDNTYLIRDSEGHYEMYADGDFLYDLSDEYAAEMIKSGFPVKEK